MNKQKQHAAVLGRDYASSARLIKTAAYIRVKDMPVVRINGQLRQLISTCK